MTGLFFFDNAFLVSNRNEIRDYNFEGELLWTKTLFGNLRKCSIYKGVAYVAIADKETGFEKTYLVHLTDGKYLESNISDFIITSISGDGRALVFKYNSDYTRNTYCIQLSNEKVIWETNLKDLPSFVDDNNLISAFKKSISSIDGKGQKRWEYDTSELGNWSDYDGKEKTTEVSRILGVRNEALYSYLNNGSILVLNIKSGEKIAVVENDKNTDQGSFSGMFMKAIELDKESGKLIQLFNQRYTEVDLESNVVKQLFLDDFKDQGIGNMSRFVYDSDHIYFTDKNSQTLGALNRTTHKLDWTHKLSQEGVSESEQPRYGRELKLNGDRLYVLDNKNTLHIFEKESHPA